MPKITRKPPAYRLHKSSGQARVCLWGQDHYLGLYGSRESKERYARLVADWAARAGQKPHRPATPTKPAASLSIAEAILAFRKFVTEHYVKDGKPTKEVDNYKDALKPVRALFGKELLAEFGPLRYEAVRQAMIDSGLCRKTVNDRMGRIRRWAKWCVRKELAPADLLYRLQAVPPLLPGRDGVRESQPVRPVALEHVEAARKHVRPPVRAMIDFQLATGCRPGEVVRLTTGQIDRTGAVWVYRPDEHKTSYRGRTREIYIGPRGQEILKPWLKADPNAPLFSPAEDERAHMAEKRAARKTKVQPSQQARRRERSPRRRKQDCYTVNTYGTAIARGCDKAEVPVWGPNRLRHTFATLCRARYGLEAAQIMLGHSRADVTQIYAERDSGRAVEIARSFG